MEWSQIGERVREQLEIILHTKVEKSIVNIESWEQWVSEQPHDDGKRVYSESKIYFPLFRDSSIIHALAVELHSITEKECNLIELLIGTYEVQLTNEHSKGFMETDESKAQAVREWCMEQWEAGITQAEMPDYLTSQYPFFTSKIPILLSSDYSQNFHISYAELKKLLESFFETEMILIPLLEKEWLILGSEDLLSAYHGHSEDRDPVDESLEESLASLCFGLHEMLTSEWIGECHIAVNYPMVPAQQLLQAIYDLRETIRLGRAFHFGKSIHLPWRLQLEKLLSAVPAHEMNQFLSRTIGSADHILDTETWSTLETFFQLDCNVSETAKKLYIHRNTLLYRLEKFRQETGLDVKTFHDAVLVKLAFLLYKVTKRK